MALADLVSLELCSGGGGTAIGLEQAGFAHGALVEIDSDCCTTLHRNRPDWLVKQGDIGHLSARKLAGKVDLLSAGLPCTPHSRGGKQLGQDDDRHLWADARRIIAEAVPRAVMIETADAILTGKFTEDRAETLEALHGLGYTTWWQAIDCSQHGMPQKRRRAILVAFREPEAAAAVRWPEPRPGPTPTVGDMLHDLMAANGWPGADAWAAGAQDAAPTVVGGSQKHGGADLGASQGKAAWRRLGIDPLGIADGPPGPDGKYQRGAGLTRDAAEAGPMLTVRMAARIQGFPDSWMITGAKTAAYRQVGNAFPPPVARVLGLAIRAALLEAGS